VKSVDSLNGSDEFELSSQSNPSDEDGIQICKTPTHLCVGKVSM